MELNRRSFIGSLVATAAMPTFALDTRTEFEKCRDDILYWVDNYLVYDAAQGELKMSPQQREYLKRISTAHDYFFCAKGRQIGISTANNVFAYWKTTFFENQHVFIVEPSARMVDAVCHMPRVSSSSFKMNDGFGTHVITPRTMMTHDLTNENHTYILDEFDFWDEHSLDKLSKRHLDLFLVGLLFKSAYPNDFKGTRSKFIVPSSMCSPDRYFAMIMRHIDKSRCLVLPSPTRGLKA